jgi:hypothetical protein
LALEGGVIIIILECVSVREEINVVGVMWLLLVLL